MKWLIAMLWLYFLENNVKRKEKAGKKRYEPVHHRNKVLP